MDSSTLLKTGLQNDWVISFQAQENAKLRLFCLHHAGGSAALFRKWVHHLPDEIELCAIQLPGRGNHRQEPVYTDMALLTERLAAVLQPYCDRPFVLFGHSLGGLLAFDLARYLQQQALPMPQHLYISARRAPHLPNPFASLWRLPDRELIEHLQVVWPWFHQEMASSPLFIERSLPALRTDLHLVESYRYQETEALTCPLSIFGGDQDSNLPEEVLQAWQQHTRCAFQVRMFAGGHFYLRDRLEEVVQVILQSVHGMNDSLEVGRGEG